MFTSPTYTSTCGATAIGVQFAEGGEIAAVALTPCCQAAATGAADYSTDMACKACYREVSSLYGTSGYTSLLQAANDKNCPVPETCADHMQFMVTVGLVPSSYRADADV